MALIEVLPDYEPKLNETMTEKIDLNIRDLQVKYPNGCTCCGNTYLPRKYSSMIASHFNTKKHKKLTLTPSNILFKNDYGNSDNLTDAFDKKCKENRELKKLNHEYKDELDSINKKYKSLETLNINLQKKILNTKVNQVRCDNLIDL